MSKEVLKKLNDEYDELFRQAGLLLVGLSVEQCNWKAKPGSWSVGECFAHLTRTAELYLPRMEAGLAKRRTAGSSLKPASGFIHDFKTRSLLSLAEQGRMRWPAPKSMRPSSEHAERSAKQVLQEFVAAYTAVRDYLEQVESDVELSVIRVKNPVLPIFCWTMGQCLLLHIVHARRHFAQAEQVKEHCGFPT